MCVRYNCLSPGDVSSLWSHMHVLRGDKKHSQRHKQLKLKSTSKSGAFLNPGALIIALPAAVNYMKRCDFMRARSIHNYDQHTMCLFLNLDLHRNTVIILAAAAAAAF